jgi:tetratricopeptide (TPR) repeat protein
MAMSYAFEGNCKKTLEYEQKVMDFYKSEQNYFQQGEVADEGARVCIDNGDLKTAEEWYKLGHDLGLKEPGIKPDRVDLWNFRWEHAQARTAARRGNKAEAEKHVAAAKMILDKGTNPNQVQFFPYLVGYVALYTGDYKAAIDNLQKANQNDPFIQCLMAEAYEKVGEKQKAAELYKQASTTMAHNPAGAYAHRVAKDRKIG